MQNQMQTEMQQIQQLMNQVPTALPEDRFVAVLKHSIESLRPATETVPCDETMQGAALAHQWLSAVLAVAQILTDEIEKVRTLTAQERSLVNELDELIGGLALKGARIVKGLK